MTTRRYFINFAPTQNLSSSITSGATSLSVSSFAGWPTQFPFFAVIDYGNSSNEIVSVTNIAGSVATIVRAQGGTIAVAHLGGASFDQTAVAQDFDEASAHTSVNTGVHGVSGNVVGTNDTQSLSNKTFTGTTAMAAVTATTVAATGAVTAASTAATGAVTGATVTATGLVQGATVTSTGAVNAVSGAISGALTVGTEAVTGASTAASYTANANGAVTGVLTPKQYANEAAATSAAVNTAGNTVYLTAPTTGPPGQYTYFNGVWTYSGPKTVMLMRQTTLQSIPNQATTLFTNLTWSGTADVAQGFATAGATGITITYPGIYRINGLVALPFTPGAHGAWILKNATAVNGGKNISGLDLTASMGPEDVPVGPLLVLCAAGDVISIGAQQSSGGAQNTVVTASEYSFVQVEQI